MVIFMIPEFNIAFKKAAEINRILALRSQKGKFVPLEDIIDAVKQVSHYDDIILTRASFLKLKISNDADKKLVSTCGAMLSTMSRKNPVTKQMEQIANLIINSDFDANMQRFSVAHELGHLITDIPNFSYEEIDDGQSTISAHINADITYISEEECEDNKYLVAEQVANIFALLVLIPYDIKIKDILETGVKTLREDYGVTEDAIYSRMLLSNIKIPRNIENTGEVLDA
jgi:Zn-dependent peptidase ImmA (M78 family)